MNELSTKEGAIHTSPLATGALWPATDSRERRQSHSSAIGVSRGSLRPGCGTITNPKNYALAPTGTVHWFAAYAASTSYDNDIVHDLACFSGYYPQDMYQNNVLLSNNSGVSGGEYFDTYYKNSGVSYC